MSLCLFAGQDRCSPSENLLYVMASVGQVKLPPLACRQRSEDGMVQDLDARAIALFALRDELVHRGNLGTDVGNDFLRGHAPGKTWSGDLRPLGKYPKFRDRGAATLCLKVGTPASGFPAFRQRSKAFRVPV